MRFQFRLDCVWVVFITAKVKGTFISQRSDVFNFPIGFYLQFMNRVWQIIFVRSFVIFCTIYNLRLFSGVPNGAARQNTPSSCRIWASWEKLHWLISWLGNLNERLANLKYRKFMSRFWLDKKVYFFSWQWHCNFFFMDIRVTEASKCAWKSPHANCRNDTCVLSVIVCKSFHAFDWSWNCKVISF